MLEAEIAAEIIKLVPHWYQACCGPQRYSLTVGEHREYFFNHRKLTPALEEFFGHIQKRLRDLPVHYFETYPSLIDVFLESLAVEWLRLHRPQINWKKLVKYLEVLSLRTFENQPVALNLILRPGEGDGDITRAPLQKVFDQLASSPMTFLVVDPELRFMDYGEVAWSQCNARLAYKFYPEMLHPIHCCLQDGEISAHLTAQGDLVILGREGLLAARRKRKWRVYDVRTFKNSLAQCLGKYDIGASIFEIVFDLSFLRYGALLVYDPEHKLRRHIRNEASILYSGWREKIQQPPVGVTAQDLIRRSVEHLAMGDGVEAMQWKRRLIELARVDGAVVFDDRNLLAVGAIIETHPEAGNQIGARTTAARSAYLWGAHPIKISADGEVTVYFTSRKGSEQCEAVMHFL
jgi:hypothetical protein